MPESALRVDFIITELFVGGAERCVAELAIGMAKRGDRVRVASLGSLPSGAKARYVDKLRDHDIEVFSAGCDHVLQFFRAESRLRRWLQADRPQVVQTMLFHANVLGTRAALASQVPCRVGGVRVAERSRWRGWLEARAFRRNQAIVCVSDSVRKFVLQHHRTDTPLHVVGNSIDLQEVDGIASIDWKDTTQGKVVTGEQVLLFVGRLHAQKGLDTLLEALPELLVKHADLHVVIVGDGPLYEWVRVQARKIDASRISIVGWRCDAHAMMKGCRLLVLPSRYEGMPNVVMEAMACRKPVAVTRVEGVQELLREGALDQTCPPGDPVALRDLIDRLWSDPRRAAVIGQTNRDIVAAHHSIDAMVDAYRDLYRSLLTGTKG